MSLHPLPDTLISFDPNTMAPQPGFAESWETSDPKTLASTTARRSTPKPCAGPSGRR
jgi:hypothetical protein